jgi:hypothetical protein
MKNKFENAGLQWLMLIILPTQEAEIRMIMVQSQPRWIVHETLSWKKKSQKRAGGVAWGVGPEFKPQHYKYIYIYLCVCIHIYMCIYIYTYMYMIGRDAYVTKSWASSLTKRVKPREWYDHWKHLGNSMTIEWTRRQIIQDKAGLT